MGIGRQLERQARSETEFRGRSSLVSSVVSSFVSSCSLHERQSSTADQAGTGKEKRAPTAQNAGQHGGETSRDDKTRKK